jgi:phosphosulfolactate synthase
MAIDNGVPTAIVDSVLAGAAEYLDFLKLGWGTAVLTNDLAAKLELLRAHNVSYYFGGTLFEKHLLQDKFEDFRLLCLEQSCEYVEVSNGTIELSNFGKAGYIRKLAADFTVISEVGFKNGERSELLPPSQWIDYIHEDLEAGASYVTLEARESGRSGICRPNGELRFGLIEDILQSGVDPDRLLFEAPTTALQSYFVKRVGSNVNLGNIPLSEVIALETLRLGLRSDTLTEFEAIAT